MCVYKYVCLCMYVCMLQDKRWVFTVESVWSMLGATQHPSKLSHTYVTFISRISAISLINCRHAFFQWDSFFCVSLIAIAIIGIVPWLQFTGAHEQECQRSKDVCTSQNAEYNLPLSVCLLLSMKKNEIVNWKWKYRWYICHLLCYLHFQMLERQPWRLIRNRQSMTVYWPVQKWCRRSWAQCQGHCLGSQLSQHRSGIIEWWKWLRPSLDYAPKIFGQSSRSPVSLWQM